MEHFNIKERKFLKISEILIHNNELYITSKKFIVKDLCHALVLYISTSLIYEYYEISCLVMLTTLTFHTPIYI